MRTKSLGQFIAALRKANGMTQQDVAERLNVSNKAVSRWERDETAPDISLIPALAEIFNVTCDELLKGERILNPIQSENSRPKIDKQIKLLESRMETVFKNYIYISVTLSIIGLVLMLGISYGLYLPVVGFAVMLIFQSVAVAFSVIAVNKLKTSLKDNEILESADKSVKDSLNICMGKYSFNSFLISFSAIAYSVPFIMYSDSYVQSVLALNSYFKYHFVTLSGLILILYHVVKPYYMTWASGYKRSFKETVPKNIRIMNIIQWVFPLLISAIFIIAPYSEMEEYGYSNFEMLYDSIIISAFVLVILCITVLFIFMRKYKNEKAQVLLHGIRNVLYCIPAVMLFDFHSVVFLTGDEIWTEATVFERMDYWNEDKLILAVIVFLLITVCYKFIQSYINKKRGCSV